LYIEKKKNHEHDLKDFSFTFLELPKFHNTIGELSTLEEKWIYFFKHADETSDNDLKTLVEHAPIIERAYDQLDRFHWNEEELLTYEQAEKYEWDHNAIMGLKFDEGMEKGMEKGRQEEKLEIVKAMILRRIDLEIMAAVTNLSKEEIKKLLS